MSALETPTIELAFRLNPEDMASEEGPLTSDTTVNRVYEGERTAGNKRGNNMEAGSIAFTALFLLCLWVSSVTMDTSSYFNPSSGSPGNLRTLKPSPANPCTRWTMIVTHCLTTQPW